MLGLGDIWVALGFWLMILSSVLCIIYGIINWNKGGITKEELEEEQMWAKEEEEVEETL